MAHVSLKSGRKSEGTSLKLKLFLSVSYLWLKSPGARIPLMTHLMTHTFRVNHDNEKRFRERWLANIWWRIRLSDWSIRWWTNLSGGFFSRNFNRAKFREISIFEFLSLNCQFWGKVTRIITRVNSWIFSIIPFTWFLKFRPKPIHFWNQCRKETDPTWND